jgi:hypothetical protein
MNLIDFFIIYLACGAPFGVYYFLQHRGGLDSRLLWLKRCSTLFFGCPLLFYFSAEMQI